MNKHIQVVYTGVYTRVYTGLIENRVFREHGRSEKKV